VLGLGLRLLRRLLRWRQARIDEGTALVTRTPLAQGLHEVVGVVRAEALDVLPPGGHHIL